MKKILTVIFKDVEDLSDVSLRSVSDAKDSIVVIVEGGTPVVVKIAALEEAIAAIKEF